MKGLAQFFGFKKPEKPSPEGDSIYSDSKKIASSFLLVLVAGILTLPVFILLYRYVPDIIIPLGKGIRVDHILAFALIFIVIRLLLNLIRRFIFGLILILLTVLVIGQIAGRFGFSDVYNRYTDLISYMGANPVKIPFLDLKKNIPSEDRIREAIDYSNPEVRDFAVKSSLKYFRNDSVDYRYRHLVKYFSVFKVMSRWEYIPDPKGEEYFASASESIRLMSGDCDDYSILMAALTHAIGADVRLVRTSDHLYPEVKIGNRDDLPGVIHLIKNKLFYKESLGGRIYYHEDDWGNIWLNFDYTNAYPGGQFMSGEIVGIMYI